MNQGGGGGGILEPIPITQEDKAFLGVKRNRALRQWKIIAIIALVASVITIVIGIVQVQITDFVSYFFGQPIMVGLITIVLALISVCAGCEGRNCPEGDQTTGCFKCLVIFYMIISLFVVLGCGVLLLFWFLGLVQCFNPADDTYVDQYNPCESPDGDTIKALAVVAGIATLVLTVLNLSGFFVYCCNTRAFGFKSRNEMMLEYQMDMFNEAQRRQGQPYVTQQVPSTYVYQPRPTTDQYKGYQPEAGPYNAGQGKMYGTASPESQTARNYPIRDDYTHRW